MAEEVKVEKEAAPKKAPAKKTATAAKAKAPAKAPAKSKAPKPEVAVEVKKTRSATAKKTEDAIPAPEPKLADIAPRAVKAPATPKEPKVKGKDAKGRTYATGKRKTSIARVWIAPGKGKITVNGKDFEAYFRRPVLQLLIVQPFQVAGRENTFDIMATIKGGGLSGQAGALKHGISRAIALHEPDLRGALKAAGFLTRDSRIVESKKYGHKKARKSFQFSKR